MVMIENIQESGKFQCNKFLKLVQLTFVVTLSMHECQNLKLLHAKLPHMIVLKSYS